MENWRISSYIIIIISFFIKYIFTNAYTHSEVYFYELAKNDYCFKNNIAKFILFLTPKFWTRFPYFLQARQMK